MPQIPVPSYVPIVGPPTIDSDSIPATPAANFSNGYPEAAPHSPLHQAVQLARTNPDQAYADIDALLERGVHVDAVDAASGEAALHVACRYDLEAIIDQLILQGGANLDIKARATGDTPLHVAMAKGNINAVRSLLRHPLDLDARNNVDKTPLYVAVEAAGAGTEGSRDAVRLLLERQPNVSASCSTARGSTPAHLMARYNLASLLEDCLYLDECMGVTSSPSSGIMASDNDDETLMHYAVRGGSVEAVTLLLHRAPELCEACNGRQQKPIDVAVALGLTDIQLLLSRSRLLAASETGDLAGVAMALESPNVCEELDRIVDKRENTAIHLAASNNHVMVLERLYLRAPEGCSKCLTVANGDGDTPLFAAVRRNQKNAVTFLLDMQPALQAQYDASTNNSSVRKMKCRII